jgi:internalin A
MIFLDKNLSTIQCYDSGDPVNVQGLVNDIVKPDVFTSDNKEENLMSDQRTFIFNAPTQFHEKNQGEANQHNYTSDPSIKNAIAEIRDILNKLNNKHPNINETEATEIIQAEFTEIQTTQPQKWKIIKQIFDGKRWVNGSKQAIIKVGEHYTENSALGKGLIGFAEGFTENE